MNLTPRDKLIGDVRRGDLTPEQAEAEVARLGLGPLASEPDPASYDPMKEVDWTLPMAVAWIAYRTRDAVREWWDDYRAERWIWRFQAWQAFGAEAEAAAPRTDEA
jgi:hypothetical protein